MTLQVSGATETCTLRPSVVALSSRNLREALGKIAAQTAFGFHLSDEGTIAVASQLSPLDRRALSVEVLLAPGTLSLRGDTTLVRWLSRWLAQTLVAEQNQVGASLSDDAVRQYVEAHEASVPDAAVPSAHEEPSVRAVLELVRLGRIAVADGAEQALSELVMRTPRAELYETLLDSELIEDLFLSESDLLAAL